MCSQCFTTEFRRITTWSEPYRLKAPSVAASATDVVYFAAVTNKYKRVGFDDYQKKNRTNLRHMKLCYKSNQWGVWQFFQKECGDKRWPKLRETSRSNQITFRQLFDRLLQRWDRNISDFKISRCMWGIPSGNWNLILVIRSGKLYTCITITVSVSIVTESHCVFHLRALRTPSDRCTVSKLTFRAISSVRSGTQQQSTVSQQQQSNQQQSER